MPAIRASRAAMSSGLPELSFGVGGAEPQRYAAAPTIEFTLVVGADAGQPISSVLLDVQIQIAARQRPYDADGAHGALLELFGTPDRWGSTLRTLLWTRTTVIVPSFEGSTEVGVPVPCTYDLEVTSGRYFAALSDGEVPLEFLFSGTVFFLGSEGMLQTARISLDHEVAYRLPVSVWREAIERHFPQSAWLRLGREHFDRLCTFKARRGLPSWDAAVDALLEGREEP